jgi:hypothetical protein
MARVVSECASFERIDSLLSYDPETGILKWKISPGRRVRAGAEAGYLNEVTGYLNVGVDGRLYQAHRIAWLLHEGHWPEGNPEHENRIGSDNRWANIRDLARDQSQNLGNQSLRVDNISGLRGVYLNRRKNKWGVEIQIRGNKIHVGYFDDPRLAGLTYDAASKLARGIRFSNLNFPSEESEGILLSDRVLRQIGIS